MEDAMLTTKMCLDALSLKDPVEVQNVADIHSAFRQASRGIHPDHNGSEEAFSNLRRSKDILIEKFQNWKEAGFKAYWFSFSCHELSLSKCLILVLFPSPLPLPPFPLPLSFPIISLPFPPPPPSTTPLLLPPPSPPIFPPSPFPMLIKVMVAKP
jgi:hypothetical protein